MKAPHQDRSRESTERMLTGALAALGQGGLSALTVDNVARLSETSNGAIYHRFGSRDGLVAATIDHFMTAFESATEKRLATLDDEEDATAVRELVSWWLDEFARHREQFRAFMLEGNEQAILAERGQRASHTLADLIVDWLLHRFGCSAITAQTCFELLLGLGASHSLFEPAQIAASRPSPPDLAREVAEIILTRVTPS